MEKSRGAALCILLLAVLLLIAAGIILGIGIHKLNESKKKSCDTSSTCPVCTVTTRSQALHFAINDPQINYKAEFSDVENNVTLNAIGEFNRKVTQSLGGGISPTTATMAQFRISLAAKAMNLQDIQTDFLTEQMDKTTFFYGTMVFDRTVDTNDVESVLNASGFRAKLFHSSYGVCNLLWNQPTPAPPSLGEFPCDPRQPARAIVVMVDIAPPINPDTSNEEKLKQIQTFLGQLSPPSDVKWGGLRMGVGVYVGSSAYLVNNFMCENDDCWQETINMLMINETLESHNVSRALEFVRDELSNPSLQLGTRPRSVILLADGFEFDQGLGLERARMLAGEVERTFYLSSILISNSVYIRETFSSIIPSSFQLLNVNYWYQIQNNDIVERAMDWACSSEAVTLPPVTASTKHWTNPMITETTTTRAHRPTGPTTPPALATPCDGLHILFLVEMSQTIGNYFTDLRRFILDTVEQTRYANATYGYVSFQNIPVNETAGFQDADDFTDFIDNIKYSNGAARIRTGFHRALEFFNNYDDFSNHSLLIYVTAATAIDLNDPDSIDFCTNVTLSLRTEGVQMEAALVTLFDHSKEAKIQSLLLNEEKLNGSSEVITTASFSSLPQLVPEILDHLDCAGEEEPIECGLDIVFLIEDSEIVDNNNGQMFARGAINAYIEQSTTIGKFQDHIAVVYYSNRDGTPHAPNNTSGILFGLETHTSISKEDLLETMNKTFPRPQGVYSDVEYGLELARSVLAESTTGNAQAIIIFGRGEFEEKLFLQCCEEPFNISDSLRDDGVLMKGAVIGSDKNATIMSMITGRDNFMVPEYGISDAYDKGTTIANQLLVFRNYAAKKGWCTTPQLEKYCPNYMDVALLLQTPQSEEELDSVKSWINETLLFTLAGVDHGEERDRFTRISIYFYSDTVQTIYRFDEGQSSDRIRETILNAEYEKPRDIEKYKLSNAYKAVLADFLLLGRPYASWSIVVFSDGTSLEDVFDAIDEKEVLNKKGVQAYGVGTTEDTSAFNGIQNIWNDYMLVNGSGLDYSGSRVAIETANFVNNRLCNNYPGNGRATVATSIPNIPTTTQPLQTQKTVLDDVDPDITIIVDTSADLNNGSQAMNDEGFESVRMFLLNNLQRFTIGKEHTRIALVTYDSNARVVFDFNDCTDWFTLHQLLTIDWQYGPAENHGNKKNLVSALQLALETIYLPQNGFRQKPNKVVWLFTTGVDSTDDTYQTLLTGMGQVDTHIFTIGLNLKSPSDMALFAAHNLLAEQFTDPMKGISSQEDLIGPALLNRMTSSKLLPPPIGRFAVDLVIALDLSLSDTDLKSIKQFLINFVSKFTIEIEFTQVALVTFNDKEVVSSIPYSKQADVKTVVNNIRNIASSGTDGATGSFDKAINEIVTNLASSGDARSSLSKYALFITKSTDSTYNVNQDSITKLHSSFTNVLSICTSNTTDIPNFLKKISTKDLYSYIMSDLTDWTIHTSGVSNPVVDFIDDIQLAEQQYLESSKTPAPLVQADLIVLVDQSQLHADAFQLVKNYVEQFVGRFTISPFGVRFSGMSYSNQPSANLSISTCTDPSCVALSVAEWKPSNSTVKDPSILSSVLHYTRSTVLSPGYGWTQTKTYILMLSSAYSLAISDQLVSELETLKAMNAYSIYVDLNQRTRDVEKYVEYYLPSPNGLIVNSTVDKQIEERILEDFRGFRYPLLPGVYSISAKLLFAIDISIPGTLDQATSVIRSLLNDAPINTTQYAVVLYNKDGVSDQSFYFGAHSTKEDLEKTINDLREQPSDKTDLASALDYVNNKLFMASFAVQKPVMLTLVASNPRLIRPLDSDPETIDHLQRMGNLDFYAFALGNSIDVYNYMTKIVPHKQAPKQLILTDSLSKKSRAISGPNGFMQYLSNEYGNEDVPPPSTTSTTTTPTTTTPRTSTVPSTATENSAATSPGTTSSDGSTTMQMQSTSSISSEPAASTTHIAETSTELSTVFETTSTAFTDSGSTPAYSVSGTYHMTTVHSSTPAELMSSTSTSFTESDTTTEVITESETIPTSSEELTSSTLSSETTTASTTSF